MSFHRTRGRSPRRGDVRPELEADPGLFFGEPDRPAKRSWKTEQLCKQAERAATVTLAEACDDDALLGAAVAGVEPAPDAGRLQVIVVLALGKGAGDVTDARAALLRVASWFREEVARTIHRKRVPEIVFDVRLAAEVFRG